MDGQCSLDNLIRLSTAPEGGAPSNFKSVYSFLFPMSVSCFLFSVSQKYLNFLQQHLREVLHLINSPNPNTISGAIQPARCIRPTHENSTHKNSKTFISKF